MVERSEYECELIVHTDVTISGKLGQFGQAVMVKKADQITEAFVQAFSRQLARETVLVGAAATVDSALVGSAATVDSALVLPAPAGNGHRESGPGVRQFVQITGNEAAAQPPAVASATHTLGALFRRGRRVVVARTEDARWALRSQPDLGALWLPDGTHVGTASQQAAQAVPRVMAVHASSADRLATRLQYLDPARPDAPAAIAVLPRGAAVGDPEIMAALCRRAGDVSQLPVLLVAGAPWTALLAARVASTGAAHGIAVVPNHAGSHRATAPCTAALVAAALVAETVAEVRSAGLELPVIAGPVPDGRSARDLLAAGADGVLVEPRTRRVAAFVGQRFRMR